MSKALHTKDYNIKTIERSRTTVLCTLHNAVGLGIINNTVYKIKISVKTQISFNIF